jgi:hypothetical protein
MAIQTIVNSRLLYRIVSSFEQLKPLSYKSVALTPFPLTPLDCLKEQKNNLLLRKTAGKFFRPSENEVRNLLAFAHLLNVVSVHTRQIFDPVLF